MTSEIIVHLTQFGAAGLVGMLWLLERRYAAARNRQLTAAHERLMETQRDADALLTIVRDNTRAITALEASQRQLIDLLRTLAAIDARLPRQAPPPPRDLEPTTRRAPSARE